jgi:hypothetical protein
VLSNLLDLTDFKDHDWNQVAASWIDGKMIFI